MILTALPPNNWKRPLGRPRITWLNTVQRDLRASYNLTLNEAVDLAQNRPLCRLTSAVHRAAFVPDNTGPVISEITYSI